MYVAKSLTGFKLWATTPNDTQQRTCNRVCKGMQQVSNIQQRWEVGQQCCMELNPIQTGGLLRLPLAKKLNKFKTVQARTTKLSDFS